MQSSVQIELPQVLNTFRLRHVIHPQLTLLTKIPYTKIDITTLMTFIGLIINGIQANFFPIFLVLTTDLLKENQLIYIKQFISANSLRIVNIKDTLELRSLQLDPLLSSYLTFSQSTMSTKPMFALTRKNFEFRLVILIDVKFKTVLNIFKAFSLRFKRENLCLITN